MSKFYLGRIFVVISLLLIFQNLIHWSSYAYGVVNDKLIALSNQIITQQGTAVPITLQVNGTAVAFSFVTRPTHGTLTGTFPYLTYMPNPKFNGTDGFTFFATDHAGMNSNNATIKIIVTPFVPQPLISDPLERLSISFVISATMVALVIMAAAVILKGRRRPKTSSKETHQQRTKYSRLSDIIRTEDWDPSLSIFQFLLWTIVVLFAFFAVYLIRIFGGVSTPPQGGVPIYLLALMGISVAVPIASNIVSSVKYSSPTTLTSERPSEDKLPPYSDMLKEYGKPTLSRFQMFGWTWIGITVYLFVFFSKTIESSTLVQSLILPDIDPTLVALMGLSQTAFIGGKTVASRTEITQVVPDKGEIGMPVQIFGSNFGNQDTVWFGDIQIRANDIKTWMDDRIDIVVPKQITEAKPYLIKVAVGGFLTDGKLFTVTKITTESPSIVNTIPSDGSTGVAMSALVSAISDRSLESSTVNANSFTLRSSVNNTTINGMVSLSSDGKTAKLKPSANLQTSTVYVATISTAVKDIEGNAMSESKTWSFTTSSE